MKTMSDIHYTLRLLFQIFTSLLKVVIDIISASTIVKIIMKKHAK